MTDFTSSTGYRLETDDDTGNMRLFHSGTNMLTGMDWLCRGDLDALREYFRAEEDQRLGRWRDPANPEMVVIPLPSTNVTQMWDGGITWSQRRCRVMDANGVVAEFGSPAPETPWPRGHHLKRHAAAARAYFKAHAEAKPWHDAKAGEVWEVTVTEFGSRTDVFHVQDRIQGLGTFPVFEAIAPDYPVSFIGVKAPIIATARRIWPGDAS